MILNTYRIITNFLYFPFFIYFLLRMLRKKESLESLKEKNGFYSIKKPPGKLIWINAISIGESLSTLSLIKKISTDFPNSTILLTTSTQSSNKVIRNRKIKNVILQFAPIDIQFVMKKFLNYWKPDICILIESEIWPNLIFHVKKQKIPLILLNARMSEKSFKRWSHIKKISNKLFQEFDLCLVQNEKSKNMFKELGTKNVEYLGNLKFFSEQLPVNLQKLKEFSNQVKGRDILVLASSHFNEEEIFTNVYLELKKKHSNLLFIIVPRHVYRSDQITKMLKKKKMNYKLRSNQEKICPLTDCYLADTFDELGLFYKTSKCVIIGGSFINHGGQNLIEAANFNCPIITGPYMDNFIDIEKIFLNKQSIIKLNNSYDACNKISKVLTNQDYTKKLKKKLHDLCISEKGKKNIIWSKLKAYLKEI